MRDPLRTLLHDWEIKPAANAAFADGVWRRIAEQSQRIPWRCRVPDLLEAPGPAIAIVAVAVLMGFATGEAWRRHQATLERDAGLAAYVLAVDPIARTAAIKP